MMNRSLFWYVFLAWATLALQQQGSALAVDASIHTAAIRYYNPIDNTTTNFFPIGWYLFNAGEDADIAQVAEMGGNTVRIGDSFPTSISLLKHRMNTAQRYGLKVELAIHKDLLRGVRRSTPSTYVGIAAFVAALKHHPALLSWRLGDENRDLPAIDVVEAAAVLKMLDPNRQVTQVFGDGIIAPDQVDQRPFLPGTDVISFDCYKHKEEAKDFAGNEDYLRICRGWATAATAQQSSFLATTQGFGKAFREWRYPTLKEFRWDVFTAIATAGARGAMYWVYYPEGDPTGPDYPEYIARTVKPVFRELNAIKAAMSDGYNVGAIASGSVDVATLLLRDTQANKYFLIVVNNANTTRSVDLRLAQLPWPPLASGVATDLTDGHTSAITRRGSGEYHLADTLSEYDVNLYTFAGSAMP